MNIKEELIKLKQTISQNNKEVIDLNEKVDNFINWYYENIIKANYNDDINNNMQNEMRNFIEKVAVWYELRYPNYEISRKSNCASLEDNNVNDAMFNNNQYIKDTLGDNTDVKELKFDEFYNAKSFISSLPYSERYLFNKIKYDNVVFLDPSKRTAHLHLSKKGYVEMSEYVSYYTNHIIKDENIEGMHITEVLELFKKNNIKLPKNNGIESAITDYSNNIYLKEEMLNSIMYRIIERGQSRFGPRRALLFAKDFKRDIDIPMKYGVDLTDPSLKDFIDEYIYLGGSKELKCYINYFYRPNNNDLETITIEELIKTEENDIESDDTQEELTYQRILKK